MSDSTPSNLPPELFLRIQCPRCHQFQAVAVTQIAEKLHKCPQCQVTIRLPRLSQKVRGVDEVLKANPGPKPVTMRLCCPGCANILTVSPEVAGHRRRCPTCLEWFRLDLIKEGGQVEPQREHIPPHEEVIFATDPQSAAAVFLDIDDESGYSPSPPTNSGEQQDVRSEWQPSRGAASSHYQSPPPPPPPIVDVWKVFDLDEEDELPVLVERSETRYQPHVSDHSKARVLPFRLISRVVLWTTWIVLPLILLLIAGALKNVVFLLLGLAIFAFPVPIANFIMALLFRQIRCPGCHRVHSAVSHWRCGCGYNSPYEVNVFRHRCPLCRSYSGHYNCPHCESTILVR